MCAGRAHGAGRPAGEGAEHRAAVRLAAQPAPRVCAAASARPGAASHSDLPWTVSLPIGLLPLDVMPTQPASKLRNRHCLKVCINCKESQACAYALSDFSRIFHNIGISTILVVHCVQDRAEDLSLGIRVASAAVGVIRRIDSPHIIASALAAAAGGNFAPAVAAPPAEDASNGESQQPPPSPESLLPLYPPGW